jgi:hypothetical protein
MDKEIRIHVAIGGLVIAHSQILSSLFTILPPSLSPHEIVTGSDPSGVCLAKSVPRGALIGSPYAGLTALVRLGNQWC